MVPAPGSFRLVPFLVELRAVMDWVWTDTTLSLSSWMCVEDIYANIFIIKCSRETEKVPGPKAGSEGHWSLPIGADGPHDNQVVLVVPPTPHLGAANPRPHEVRRCLLEGTVNLTLLGTGS